MKISIATLFPAMCEAVIYESIIGRAIKADKLSVSCYDIRAYSTDKHRRVDDTTYGGGKGMLMQADPIYRCYEAVAAEHQTKPHVIYMSPQGSVLTHEKALALSKLDDIFILCGHYEGVDQRVLDLIVDEEISIGDYVLTGGELPALVLVDAIGRLCEGVLSDEAYFTEESHYNGLLEYPQYTKPAVWNGMEVPAVLLNGHHKNIEAWRKEQALENTRKKRPDLL